MDVATTTITTTTTTTAATIPMIAGVGSPFEEESVLAVSAALVAVSAAAAVVSSAVVASTALSYPKPDTVNVISMLVTSPINVLSLPPSCSLTAS